MSADHSPPKEKEAISRSTHSKAIDVIELSRYFNSRAAVDAISFHVNTGKVLGLLGPNGAGKSTTIKMLTTLLPSSSGSATISGYNINTQPSLVRQCIGYVPQLISADGDLSAYENLTLSAKLHGIPVKARRERISEVLDFMGLNPYAHQLVSQYSGGMIRRVEIAQALLHEPKVLFLDEPTVGLDPAARKMLWEHIEKWRKRFGTTILITTHDMDEADRLCDTIAFMYMGKIVRIGSPDQLKAELGEEATLGDVFVKYTGTSINAGGNYADAKETRRTISHLD